MIVIGLIPLQDSPVPTVLLFTTTTRKPCIVATAILGCSGGESLAPVKPERSAEQTDSPVPNPTQVLSGDYIPPVQTPLPLPADEPNPFETELQFNNENFARAWHHPTGIRIR